MSNKEFEEPMRVKSIQHGCEETLETHPAYAMIGASRTNGGAQLFGSDFEHHRYITITIHKANQHRSLSRDWQFAERELISVALSEAQWASFVSSMNVGSGVPCTLEHVAGKRVPGITGHVDVRTSFKEELAERLKIVESELAALKNKIVASTLSGKAKSDLISTLECATRNLTPNLSFVADQFGEHIEVMTEKAKIEVGAYIQSAISRAGLTALRGASPIELPSVAKETESPS